MDKGPKLRGHVATDDLPVGNVEMGQRAVKLILDDAPALDDIHDPRAGDFAAASTLR